MHLFRARAYRTICVEVDIFNLAVNTVLEASTLADIEGASEAFLGDVELDFNSDGGNLLGPAIFQQA